MSDIRVAIHNRINKKKKKKLAVVGFQSCPADFRKGRTPVTTLTG